MATKKTRRPTTASHDTKKMDDAPRGRGRGRGGKPRQEEEEPREHRTQARASTSRRGGAKSADVKVERIAFDGVRVSRDIGGRALILESGRMAKQADGAVVARYGDTMVLATAQSAKAREDVDFFPLTVDYRERAAAAGKFPGGFFKREGRPTTREILTCRIIDRAVRPMFPENYRDEVQVLLQVLSTDQENEADVTGAVAAFAAIAMSSIPSTKTLGACRIGLANGELLVNPSWTQVQAADNSLNLTVAAAQDAIVMVEAGAREVPEDVMIEALELAHNVNRDVIELIEALVAEVGKDKQAVKEPERDTELEETIRARYGRDLLAIAAAAGDKHERKGAKEALVTAVMTAFPAPAGLDEKAVKLHGKRVSGFCAKLIDEGERQSILRGQRADGRGTKDIRQITIEIDVLPRVHGSVLFTRGETQALAICTLGTSDDAQRLDGIYPEPERRFLLHYNFPPYSVGEVRRVGTPGRREVGHGALAERSLEMVLPSAEQFPYTIRITSDILESNGSSSMASVCAGTLAMMDAGVPIAQPVAGIAMGLVMDGSKYSILSDILGSEDHCGDMDFKVAGTPRGITALQMDIKCEGLTREILEEALAQAREGRIAILRKMLATLRTPRAEISPHAPRLLTLKIPEDKIGAVIGPGGRMVRGLQEEFAVKISIEDDGRVTVAGPDVVKVEAAFKRIKDMTAEVEVGTVYTGKVTSVKEFGCFVEILPGQEGMVHVSELADGFVRSVTDVVRIGDEIEVKVIGIDDFGKIKLSRRALLAGDSGGAGAERQPERGDRPFGRDRDRGERGGRGDRGERGDRDRGDRDRSDRGDRGDRGDRDRGRGFRPRHDDAPRTERGDRDDRRFRSDRGDRGDQPLRGDRVDDDRTPPDRGRPSEGAGEFDEAPFAAREVGDRDEGEPMPAQDRGDRGEDRPRHEGRRGRGDGGFRGRRPNGRRGGGRFR